MKRKLLIAVILVGGLAAASCHRQVCPAVGKVNTTQTEQKAV